MFGWLKSKYEPTEEDYKRIAERDLNRKIVERVLGFDPHGAPTTTIIGELCRQIEVLKEEVRNK